MNWGLGHATRCIPIIHTLLDQDATVTIGADGRPLELLRDEFPTLPYVRFPGLNISYKGNLTGSMIRQLPHIAVVTRTEHVELETIVKRLAIDAVISDNRFGLFLSNVPCVYMTHQIGIMMPATLKWARTPVTSVQNALINRFSECWIPDFGGSENLCGDLAHQVSLPQRTYYIGPLSRFRKLSNVKKGYDLIAILSGPEPQRTILEDLVLTQLRTKSIKALVVRGIPGADSETTITKGISTVSHLSSEELNRAILSAEVVLSRPGYSTIMDLAVLGSRAIFIPTPGQTEQEYLASLYHHRGLFYSERQEDFQLDRAMREVSRFTGFQHSPSGITSLSERIQNLLASIP